MDSTITFCKIGGCLAIAAGLALGALADGAVELPEGYRRVAFLASDGAEWVNTGIDSRSAFGFEMGLRVYVAGGGGMAYAGGGNFYFTEYNTTPYNAISCRVCNSDIAKNKSVSGGSVFNDLAVKDGVFTINGTQQGTYTSGSALSTSAGNIFLFANSATSAGRSMISYARIYDADGGLLRNFVPVLDADGRPGFYDAVSNECCYSATTTDLVAGPVVPNADFTVDAIPDQAFDGSTPCRPVPTVRDADGNALAIGDFTCVYDHDAAVGSGAVTVFGNSGGACAGQYRTATYRITGEAPSSVPGETLPVGSYVQNGLVTQWDGFNNAGVGLHDAYTNVWKDLKGNLDLTLNANGFWSDKALEVRGYAGVAAAAASAYLTIEVVCQLDRGIDSLVFTPGTGDTGGNGYDRTVHFQSNGKVCRVSNPWSSAVKQINYAKFDPDADLQLAATFSGTGQPIDTFTNGVNTGSGVVLQSVNGGGCGKAAVGGWSAGQAKTGTAPTFGRIYAIRLYSKVLSAGEIKYNAAVDAVRFGGKSPAEVFTDDMRWNAETGKPEFRLNVSSLTGAGKFSINGGEASATQTVWVAQGESVTLSCEDGETVIGWQGLPSDAVVSADLKTATFTAASPVAATVKVQTVRDITRSFLADPGIEEGGYYASNKSGQKPSTWSGGSSGLSSGGAYPNGTPGLPTQYFFYNLYQQNNALTQTGVCLPAGDYYLVFNWKRNTAQATEFRLTDSSSKTTVLCRIQPEASDGSAWHREEIPFTMSEDGVYTFTAINVLGGNNGTYFDNIAIVSASPTDLTIDPIDPMPYLGEQIRPPVTVRDAEGRVLAEGTDYELKWGANKSGRLGFVAAVGKGDHYGTAPANFRIGIPVYVKAAATGTGDGSSWENACDWPTALSKVGGSSPLDIWVAGERIEMTAAAVAREVNLNVMIRGGFAGTEASPDEREPGARTVMDGMGEFEIARLQNRGNVMFERFVFQNGNPRAVHISWPGDKTFADCDFIENGSSGGGAVYIDGQRQGSDPSDRVVATFRNCRFARNRFSTETVNKVAYTYGAISALSMNRLVLEDCTFETNGLPGEVAYANGSTIRAVNSAIVARNCRFVGNQGLRSAHGIVRIEGARTGTSFDHCLFLNNAMTNSPGASASALSVKAGSVQPSIAITGCTFAGNLSAASVGAALNLEGGTTTVRNSIFFGNRNGAEAMGTDLTATANAPCDLDFSLFEANDMAHVMLGSADSVKGDHILTGDPLFVSEDDVHLLSEAGYFDATGGVHYAAEGVISPAIDGGDPAASFANEPDPNGGRVNLGYYGNTAEASYSLFGSDTPSDYPHLTIKKISAVTAVGCTVSYRIDFTDPVDLFICYGEDPDAPAHTNIITSAARIGSYTITGLSAGVDYFVKLYARAEDGRDGACDPVPFTTVAISSQSYVRDGLVAQFDGFDNMGLGLHDGTTNVWKDLVGNLDLTLTENGSFGDSWLDVSGKSATAATKAPSYRTIEILCRMTNSAGTVVFASGIDDLHLFLFGGNGTRCDFSRIWYQNGNHYLPLTFLATVDRCITATYKSDGYIDNVFVNGAKVAYGHDSGAYKAGSTGVATLGSYGDGTGPWYGRVYAIRLYNRTLTDEEVKLNGAVDMVRYQQADPETAFSGDFRWNTATRKIEARCSFATDGGDGGFFTVNGVETSDVWLPVGGRVELLYTSGQNEQRPLEWHGLPTTAVISNDLRCVAFDVTAAVNATLQISRAGDPELALNADGGLEEGACYVHPNGYNVQTWTRTDKGDVSCHSPNNERQGHCYHRPYQTGGLSQSGLVIPAGNYILSYQYKCDTSGTVTSFGITGTNGVVTTLATVQSDSQRDGSAWHSAEVDVSIPETGIYSLWFKNTSGGNCYSSIDNLYLTSISDLLLDEVPNQPYLGGQVRPPVKVSSAAGVPLTEGTDYEVLYGKNDGSGNGIGFVAVVGKGSHYGVIGRNFRIGTPIYVTPEGLPGNEGTNWTSAVDFATALAKAASGTSKAWEIWVAGSNVMTAAAVERTTSKNLMVRGGFAGDEATPGERPDGALSVLDGQGLYEIARHKNLSHVEYERILFRNAPVRAVTKTGFAGDVKFYDCVFARNGGEGGGATAFTGWRNDGGCDPKSTAVFRNCLFTENASASGTAVNGGCVNAGTMNVTVEDSLFVTNGVSGTAAYRKGAAIYTTLGTVRAKRTEFRGNVGGSGGAIVQVESVSKDSSFANCLFIGNHEMTSALTLAPDSVLRKAEVVNCTFAYNDGCSTSAAAGLQASVGQIRVWNSIFYGNANGETNDAVDLRGGGSSILDVGYTLFGSDSSESYFINNGASLAGGTCYFADPLFVSETDAHLQSEQGYFDATGGVHKSAIDVRSPGIDAGDPTFAVGDEQEPNGEIVNLGAYGGTRYASLTPVADPAIAGLEIGWDAQYTQPTVTFTAGGTGSYGADVTVYVSTDGGMSWTYVSRPIGGITKGTTKSLLVPLYFPEDTKIWVRADIHGAGKTVPSELLEVDVEGKLPPWYGKKGPGNVIHVRPGATGLGDGTSWTDAIGFADALALVTEDKNEIWVAGTNLMTGAALTLAFEHPVRIRGGFTGVECAAAERMPGAESVLDGGDLYDILLFTNKKGVEVERLVFTRGANRGMKKFSSSGDLTVVDCTFFANGRLGTWEQPEAGGNVNAYWQHGGAGLSVYGNGAAHVVVRNCRFEANTTKSGASSARADIVSIGCGGGAFVGSCADLLVDGCSFVTNYPGANTSNGDAHGLLLSSTIFVVTNCLFVGHGAKAMAVCTGFETATNRIVNCRFVANRGGFFGGRDKALPFAVENCTFAYNYGDAAFQLNRGTATVRNSIFWNVGADMSFANSSSATLDYTLVGGTNSTWFGTGATFGEHMFVGVDPLLATSTNVVCELFRIPQLRSGSYTLPNAAELVKFNVHLRGRCGYWDETTGRNVRFHDHSPAIDAGDPAVVCVEPVVPQSADGGGRVNLGAYGNTPWATLTRVKGAFLSVR